MRSMISSVVIFLLIGCNTVTEEVEDVTPPAPMPVSTPPVLDHIDNCWDDQVIGMEEAKMIFLDCQNNLGPNCQDQYDLNVESIEEWYWNCLQMLPAVEQSCREAFDPQSFDHDSDGDGISDADEVLMSLNPCEPCSYGGNCQACGGGGEDSSSCDSEMDFDNDGMTNGEDENPACGSIYGYFPARCV